MPLTVIDQATTEGSYIVFKFTRYSASGKTAIWDVVSKDNLLLGRIEWFGRWRKYWFLAYSGSGFEEVCLREIADFVEGLTKSHRAAKKSGVKCLK